MLHVGLSDLIYIYNIIYYHLSSTFHIVLHRYASTAFHTAAWNGSAESLEHLVAFASKYSIPATGLPMGGPLRGWWNAERARSVGLENHVCMLCSWTGVVGELMYLKPW